MHDSFKNPLYKLLLVHPNAMANGTTRAHACYFRRTHRETTSDISLAGVCGEQSRRSWGTVKGARTTLALVGRVRFLFLLFLFFLSSFFSPRFVSRRRDIELLRAAIPDALRPQRLKGAGYELLIRHRSYVN